MIFVALRVGQAFFSSLDCLVFTFSAGQYELMLVILLAPQGSAYTQQLFLGHINQFDQLNQPNQTLHYLFLTATFICMVVT